MASLIYLVLAFYLYGLTVVKSRDFLHPLAIGTLLWFLAAAVSGYTPLYDPSLQVPLSKKTHFVILVSGFMFFFPALFSARLDKRHITSQMIQVTGAYKCLFNTLLILILFSFYLRFRTTEFTPAIAAVSDIDLKGGVPEAIPFINYADVLTPFLAIICRFELRFSANLTIVRKRVLIFYILFSVVSALVYKVSRGEFLVIILGCLYIYCITNRKLFSLSRVILLFSVTGLFFFLGLHRMSAESRVSTQFGDGTLNIILSQIYTYVAMNFQNLNSLINSSFEPAWIWGSAKFFLKIFFNRQYDNHETGLQDYSTAFFNAKTYLFYFYNDMKFYGIIIYPLFISLTIQIIYNKSMQRVKFILFNAFLMKAILFMFFGNYFFGELVILFPYLFLTILVLTIKSYKCVCAGKAVAETINSDRSVCEMG